MVILWVNFRVRPPPSWNSVFGTTWLRFSSRSRFRARARNLVGPGPDYGVDPNPAQTLILSAGHSLWWDSVPSSPPPVPVFKSHCTCTIFYHLSSSTTFPFLHLFFDVTKLGQYAYGTLQLYVQIQIPEQISACRHRLFHVPCRGASRGVEQTNVDKIIW